MRRGLRDLRPIANGRRCCAPDSSSAAPGAVAALALEGLRAIAETLALEALYGAGLAFIGGAIGVGLVDLFSLPILERLFNVLTDVRLLELSNVNNPLLSELASRHPAPTTTASSSARWPRRAPRRSEPTRCSAAWRPSTTTSER